MLRLFTANYKDVREWLLGNLSFFGRFVGNYELQMITVLVDGDNDDNLLNKQKLSTLCFTSNKGINALTMVVVNLLRSSCSLSQALNTFEIRFRPLQFSVK